MHDPYDLERFVEAQSACIDQVRVELLAGEKQSHWMWFIFPQLKGLGHSPTATWFGIGSLEEAEAFLQHPVLGARLRECTQLVLQIEDRTVEEVFGFPDHLKFHSSMTLFASATPENRLFLDALQKYFAGRLDIVTTGRLNR